MPTIAVILMFLSLPVVCTDVIATQQQPSGQENLFEMPLEDLMDQRVTTSSRRPQLLTHASNAMYVITAEDIKQSGATTVEDLLRLVPGMDVVQVDGQSYAANLRGFAKESSRRLQVLLDGQPLYDDFKGGVDLSEYPIFLYDIERIEVIRGTAGVAYGLKAVNGVVNIITKKAADTQGGFIYSGLGNREFQQGEFRLGGTNGPVAWRGSVGASHGNGFGGSGGDDIADWLEAFQTTGRAEYKVADDARMTFLGGHKFSTLGGSSTTHRSLQYLNFFLEKDIEKDSKVQVRWSENYYEQRNTTYDLRTREDVIEIQHYMTEDIHKIIWGADYTRDSFKTVAHPRIQASPSRFSDDQGSVFVEDEIAIGDNLWFTLGGRGHYNELTNFEWAGKTALVWEAAPKHLFRVSVSKAFRRPTFWEEFGRQYSNNANTILTLTGNDTLKSEQVIAYELGYRGQMSKNFELNIEGFINKYSHSIGIIKHGTAVRRWDNNYSMKTYGVETSIDWKAFNWWLVRGSHSYEHQTEGDKINNQTFGRLAVFTVPKHKVGLTNRFYIDKTTTFNIQTYWTDTYFDSGTSTTAANRIDPFFRVDIRLAKTLWNDNAEIAFVVNNLTEQFHYEGSSSEYEVPRQIYMQFFYKF